MGTPWPAPTDAGTALPQKCVEHVCLQTQQPHQTRLVHTPTKEELHIHSVEV